MTDLPSFRSIIELWPTIGAFADEIGATPMQAAKWAQRNTIPSEWWASILACEPARAAGATAELMARLASRQNVSTTSATATECVA